LELFHSNGAIFLKHSRLPQLHRCFIDHRNNSRFSMLGVKGSFAEMASMGVFIFFDRRITGRAIQELNVANMLCDQICIIQGLKLLLYGLHPVRLTPA